jgi:hypothetical protein
MMIRLHATMASEFACQSLLIFPFVSSPSCVVRLVSNASIVHSISWAAERHGVHPMGFLVMWHAFVWRLSVDGTVLVGLRPWWKRVLGGVARRAHTSSRLSARSWRSSRARFSYPASVHGTSFYMLSTLHLWQSIIHSACIYVYTGSPWRGKRTHKDSRHPVSRGLGKRVSRNGGEEEMVGNSERPSQVSLSPGNRMRAVGTCWHRPAA